ncbi:MAG: RDD family protein, partial [Prevotella sp.]|nr:RDD family protein [Prevotella sp.]
FYYILFESVLFASLGKRWLGGVLLDRKQKKIGFARVLIRALWSTVFMLIAVFFFHFQMNQTYFVVIPLFFFILDIPVFLRKGHYLICVQERFM